MAKGKRVPSAFFVAHVTYENGEKLELHCNDRWTAHEIANRANMLPGVKSAYYDSTGYSLFHNWESAMQSVAAFCNTESEMKSDYLFGRNPARFTPNNALIDAAQEALKLQEPV